MKKLNKIVIKERKYGGGIYQKKCGRCCKPLDYNSLPKRSIFLENIWKSCNDKVSTWIVKVSTWTIIGMVGTFILILLFLVGRAFLGW